MKLLVLLLIGACLALTDGARAESVDTPPSSHWYDRYVDREDGQFDLSDYLLKYHGLLPVPIIITEPALGYGGGVAALWFRESIAEAGARSMAQTGQKA